MRPTLRALPKTAMSDTVSVIGAGLAGCEAAFQLAEKGHKVRLFEQKPYVKSPAHHSDSFCELVCSNSLRSDRLANAAGLLKAELRLMGSLVMRCADACAVPAGGALAVDRELFSAAVTAAIAGHPNIETVHGEVGEIPSGPTVIATGPLTDGALLAAIENFFGRSLHFYDAAAPLVSAESLDLSKTFRASRYDRGSDYINCPMTKSEYFEFVNELVSAETAELHSFETPRVFEGCMPVEVMAKRGPLTLAYGPLKPVGLSAGDGAAKPFAVLQLRQDNADGSIYNLVGFQTNLKFAEQKRVFGLIPALKNAEYLRYGVMHRNTYIESPACLNWTFETKKQPLLYFAGQITGVEGYLESAASGLEAAIQLHRRLCGLEAVDFTAEMAIGALGHYVAEYAGNDFQPMNITFGIMKPLDDPPRKKEVRYQLMADRALEKTEELAMALK